MNVKSQGTESGLGRAPQGSGARTVADWMWPFLLGGGALFSISALFYYHFNRVALEPRSFLQVAFAGLYDNFGWAPTVVFFLLVFAWSLIWFVTGVLERPVSRLVRLLVMAVMLGVFLNLGDGGVVREPHKGAFGAWLAGRLVSAIGYLPSLAVVLFTTFASLLLATDWFFSDWFDRSRRPEDAEKGVEEEVTEHLRALADESLSASEGAVAVAPEESAVPEAFALEAADAGRADLFEVAAQGADADDGDGDGEGEGEGDDADEDTGQEGDDQAAGEEEEVQAGESLVVLDPSEREPDEIQLEVEAPVIASLDAMSEVADDEEEFDDEETDDEEIDEEIDDEEIDEEIDEEVDEEEIGDEEVDDAWCEDEQEGDAEDNEDAAEVEADDSYEGDEDDEALAEDALVEASGEAEAAAEDDLDVASAEVEADPIAEEGEERAVEPADAVAIPRPEAPVPGAPPSPPGVATQEDRGRQQNLFGVGVDEGLVQEARELLSSGRRPSASLLQRKLRIDYDLAQELLRELVARGLLAAEPRP